jgi:hypothetical protein
MERESNAGSGGISVYFSLSIAVWNYLFRALGAMERGRG